MNAFIGASTRRVIIVPANTSSAFTHDKKPTLKGVILSSSQLEILGLCIVGLVVMFVIGLLDFEAGNTMGFLVHRGFEPIIGTVGIFILPPALLFLSASFILHRSSKMLNAVSQYSLFICFLALPIINLAMRQELQQYFHPRDNEAVGILGASIGFMFEKLFGQSGGIVVLFSFALIFLPPVTGYAPSEIVKGILNLKNRKEPEVVKKRKPKAGVFRNPDVIGLTEFASDDELLNALSNNGEFPSDFIIPAVKKPVEEKPEVKKVEDIVPAAVKQMDLDFKPMLRDLGEYVFPNTDMLNPPVNGFAETDKKNLALKVENALADFGIEAVVEDMVVGPVIIRCELRPAPGVRVNSIKALRSELAMALSAKSLRIEAPIPGRDVMGIEFPNLKKKLVTLRELLECDDFTKPDSLLTICMGKDLAGKPIIEDLAKMPHLLIAGQTGAGKSVCLNSIIMSILYKTAPDEVKLILIDPKRVEMTLYDGLPHLLVPVVQEWSDAKNALIWVAKEMSKRLEKLQKTRCRDIASFNQKRPNGEFMPYIVIVIDEFATLMDLSAGREVERLINHLARLARATGIHLILATQRPDVKVITGSIKANIPARIAFSVPSQVDSRTILDRAGADLLLGEGDMLYRGPRDGSPRRAQGSYVTDAEIEKVVAYLMEQIEPDYRTDILEDQGDIDELEGIPDDDDIVTGFEDDNDDEEYFQEAIKLVASKKRISASMIQREFRIGYNRASRIIERMEEKGIISGWDGQRSRRLIDGNDFMENINDI